METKINAVDAKLKLMGDDDGPGSLGFYLSTFGNWDRVRPIPERPARGAFAPHLDAFIKDGFITEFHNWGKRPIATVAKAFEDDYGLWVEADFHTSPDAQDARRTYSERLARGKSVKSSMGYDILDDELVRIDDPALLSEGIDMGRVLKNIPLYEGSIVNVPANPLADVRDIKSLLQADMSLESHSQIALAASDSFVRRAKGLLELRRQGKEGRVLSAANRGKLATLKDDLTEVLGILEEILAATEPTKSARAELLAEMQKLHGVRERVRALTYGG